MLYMWHQLPYENKRAPADASADEAGRTPARASVRVPAGRAILGARSSESPFGWDNEFPGLIVDVPEFENDVTTRPRRLCQSEWWTPAAFAWIRDESIEHPRFWTRRDETWKWRGM